MARDFDPHRLSNPSVFLFSMLIFLIITGFLAAILYRQILSAFQTNPGLNGLILGVLIIGILLALVQVIRLIPEVRWVNSFRQGNPDLDVGREPVLLAPMKALLGQSKQEVSISTLSMRSILDSIGNRLDESRDISRYLIGLLVFLGLLGTFWGLLQTIGSIGDTIQSLDPNSGDANDVLDALKSGLKEPLDGMGTAFSSSLFGLAGSLVLGFLDLQAGRAQTRFYTELENWLSSVTDLSSDGGSGANDVRSQLDIVAQKLQSQGTSGRTNEALANLVESIQHMVKHMRSEQEITRQQLQQQEEQQKDMLMLLRKLNTFFEKASRD
ncbi:MAG: MotA/TolQ/ExbB proton channel family protein [Pseudomonadota bacterium]